jgi:hypothetical protein
MDANKDFQDTYFEQHIYYWLLILKYPLTTLMVKFNSKYSKFVQQIKTDIKKQICNAIFNRSIVKLKL